MPDYGAEVADKAIRDTERKLRSTYSTAQRELRKKMKDFNDRYKDKDAAKRKLLDEGKISKQDYANWKSGQVFQRKLWEDKVKEVAAVMANSNEQAAKVINEGRLGVFAENYNFSAFLGEQQLGVSFGVYNTQSVARLIADDPQILPEWKIDEEKDYIWNYKKVNNIVKQGIIQGEGIRETTKRLCTDLAAQNRNKMQMFARTAMTGAQNAGRQKQMEDAAAMGIVVHKKWLATLDSRTRDLHRDRDGEEVPHDEEFSGGIAFPGDPSGDPADVYNCRCTMITVYPQHAAYHEGGARRARVEWEDDYGTHSSNYLTTNSYSGPYEGWSEKAYRRWLGKKQEHNKVVKPEAEENKRKVVNGKDITSTWKRRENEFDFEIEDVLNAQGFDGLPRIVSQEEFDEAVKKSGFIAQRSYSAPDQETLNSYREMLYNGNWYVDCSVGSADYGQGMYCASDYSGTITKGLEAEMAHYQGIGRTRYGKTASNNIETFTLTPDAKVISYNGLRELEEKKKQEIMSSYVENGLKSLKGLTEREEAYAAMRLMDVDSYNGYTYDEIRTWMKSLEGIKKDEVMSHLRESGYRDITAKAEEASEAFSKLDKGAKAALMGYDAINVEGVGASGSYTVVLNRTKCIFLEDFND